MFRSNQIRRKEDGQHGRAGGSLLPMFSSHSNRAGVGGWAREKGPPTDWRSRGSLRSRWMMVMLRRGLLLLALVMFWVDTWRIVAFGQQEARIEEQVWSQSVTHSGQSQAQHVRSGEKVFITAIHWNSESVLRAAWIDSVLSVVKLLGLENVFVSIVESGSWDNTKGALRELKEQLTAAHVSHRVIMKDETHADLLAQAPSPHASAHGWIQLPPSTPPMSRYPDLTPGTWALRRIPYLAQLRNAALQPLLNELADNSERFDRILFLNDVFFSAEDVSALLQTRDGHYAAACALDFAHPPRFYDTFALRDSKGHEAVRGSWPFFGDHASRHAMVSNQASVPVSSCWNGIVAMDARPFYPSAETSTHSTNDKELGLSFRGVPDTLALQHVEGSECCLIHADNPLTETLGVWLNPRVRVGYSQEAYDAVRATPPEVTRDAKSPTATPPSWTSPLTRVGLIWRNRLARWIFSSHRNDRKVKAKIAKWQASLNGGEAATEKGAMCLIDEMQVLRENGWAHVAG